MTLHKYTISQVSITEYLFSVGITATTFREPDRETTQPNEQSVQSNIHRYQSSNGKDDVKPATMRERRSEPRPRTCAAESGPRMGQRPAETLLLLARTRTAGQTGYWWTRLEFWRFDLHNVASLLVEYLGRVLFIYSFGFHERPASWRLSDSPKQS